MSEIKSIAQHREEILATVERQFSSGADTVEYCTCPSMGTARGWEPNHHHALDALREEGIPGVHISAASNHGCLDWTLIKRPEWKPPNGQHFNLKSSPLCFAPNIIRYAQQVGLSDPDAARNIVAAWTDNPRVADAVLAGEYSIEADQVVIKLTE
jgi:hypothetical protein